MSYTLTLLRGSHTDYRCHGIQISRLRRVPLTSKWLCGRRAIVSSRFRGRGGLSNSPAIQTLEFLQEQGISAEHRALVFSPDSRTLMCFGESSSNRDGAARATQRQGPDQGILGTPSFTYSANEKMVGVLCWYSSGCSAIHFFDVDSGEYTPSLIAHSSGI